MVVAHYHEDLSWISDVLSACPDMRVYVYDKGAPAPSENAPPDPPDSRVIHATLPNVGRESHTYLHHILHHYGGGLEDFIFFTQGAPFEHRSRAEVFDAFLKSTAPIYPRAQPHIIFADWKLTEPGWNARDSGGTIGDWWQHCFQEPMPVFPRGGPKVMWNGMFVVRRDRILSRPKAFYERLIRTVEHDVNPEEGHFMERAWGNIFMG